MTKQAFRFYETAHDVRVYDAKPATSSWRAMIHNRLEIFIWVKLCESEPNSMWKFMATFEEGTPFEIVKEATRNFLRLGMDTGNRVPEKGSVHQYKHSQKV